MPVVSGCLYWIELLLLVLLLLLLTLLSVIQERKQEEKADDQMILSTTVDINTLVDDNSEVVKVNCFHLLQ